jgi:hypothetical protein
MQSNAWSNFWLCARHPVGACDSQAEELEARIAKRKEALKDNILRIDFTGTREGMMEGKKTALH